MPIQIDVPSVRNEEEALGLMFHHLELAVAYFEGTELTVGRLQRELRRMAEDCEEGASSPALEAGRVFVEKLIECYDEMGKEQEEFESGAVEGVEDCKEGSVEVVSIKSLFEKKED